jgi:hypothetical protein
MRVVVYDKETMEPLTVISIPGDYLSRFGRRMHFPVIQPISFGPVPTEIEPINMRRWYVTLDFEPIYNGKDPHPMMWLCTTNDGETALLLRSVFLPGQQREVQERTRDAFLSGLAAALQVR